MAINNMQSIEVNTKKFLENLGVLPLSIQNNLEVEHGNSEYKGEAS